MVSGLTRSYGFGYIVGYLGTYDDMKALSETKQQQLEFAADVPFLACQEVAVFGAPGICVLHAPGRDIQVSWLWRALPWGLCSQLVTLAHKLETAGMQIVIRRKKHCDGPLACSTHHCCESRTQRLWWLSWEAFSGCKTLKRN